MSSKEREPLVLQNEKLKLSFNPLKPVLMDIKYRSGYRLFGDDTTEEPRFELSESGVETLWTGELAPEVVIEYSPIVTTSCLIYHTKIIWHGREAVRLRITYELIDNALKSGYSQVEELPGYQLLKLRMTGLAGVSERQSGSRLVIPSSGGRLVNPSASQEGDVRGWPGWKHSVPAALVHNDRLMGIVEIHRCDDFIYHTVKTLKQLPNEKYECNQKCASLSVLFYYRAAAPCAQQRFVLKPESTCTTTYLESAGEALTWVDGARFLNERLTCRPPAEHRNNLIYGMWIDMPGIEDGYIISFKQALEYIRQFYYLSDGLKQTVMLIGWQHNGHDTGYPDMLTVNERAGGRDELLWLIKEAKKYNAVVTFHNNFHDAYRHSPAWDPAIIAREAGGELRKGGVWAGGQSYSIGYGKYAEHGAMVRIEREMELYPIHETIYLDQMNVYLETYDYDAQHPYGPQDEFEGKRKMIEKYRQYGIGVMSESFTGYMAGIMSHGWLFSDKEEDFDWKQTDWSFTQERKIPFTSFVYHGRATFGGDVRTNNDDPDVLGALYHGRTVSTHVGRRKTMEGLVLAHYLVNAPYLLLRERTLIGYEESGSYVRISYSSDPQAEATPTPLRSYVELDFNLGEYQVVADGRVVAKNDSTFVPSANSKEGAWLAYSRKDCELVYEAPAGWENDSEVEARILTDSGISDEVHCRIKDGKIYMTVAGGLPVKVRLKQ